MFNGEKTRVFWIGLTMLALASLVLFAILWYTLVIYTYFDWRYWTPQVLGAVVFILIGFYMMKSGVRKAQTTSPTTKLL